MSGLDEAERERLQATSETYKVPLIVADGTDDDWKARRRLRERMERVAALLREGIIVDEHWGEMAWPAGTTGWGEVVDADNGKTWLVAYPTELGYAIEEWRVRGGDLKRPRGPAAAVLGEDKRMLMMRLTVMGTWRSADDSPDVVGG